MAYACGLRVSEVVNVKVRDLDLEGLILLVRQGKGNKDRLTIFPVKMVEPIKRYIQDKVPDDYLFASNRGGKLSTRSVQKVFSKACKNTQISKLVSFHFLRHSFVTYLIENGVDIRYMQIMLGHNNIRTAQRYTHITNIGLQRINSPFA